MPKLPIVDGKIVDDRLGTLTSKLVETLKKCEAQTTLGNKELIIEDDHGTAIQQGSASEILSSSPNTDGYKSQELTDLYHNLVAIRRLVSDSQGQEQPSKSNFFSKSPEKLLKNAIKEIDRLQAKIDRDATSLTGQGLKGHHPEVIQAGEDYSDLSVQMMSHLNSRYEQSSSTGRSPDSTPANIQPAGAQKTQNR